MTCGVCPVTTSLSTICTAQPPVAASVASVVGATQDVAGDWPRAAGGVVTASSSSSGSSSAHARAPRALLAAGMAEAAAA
jgi:hypothetical protein